MARSLIFLRSSCLRLAPLEVARSALVGDKRAKSRRNWITRAERHLTKCGREKPSPRRIADRLFYADGVRATGTEKIMSLAEVAKATFYRHFESKDALVLAYLEYRDQALWDYFSQPTPPKDLREALTKFEQYVNWPEVIGCPFLRIAAEFPDPAHPFHRLAIEHQDKIVDYLTALLEPFAIDRRPAAAILGVINGAFSTRMLYGTSRDITLLSSAEAVLKSFQSPRAQRRR